MAEPPGLTAAEDGDGVIGHHQRELAPGRGRVEVRAGREQLLGGRADLLDLPFKLKIVGDKAQMSGETSLDRTLFGVGQGEFTATDQVPGLLPSSENLTMASSGSTKNSPKIVKVRYRKAFSRRRWLARKPPGASA